MEEEKNNEELEKCNEEKEEYLESLKRAKADFLNYKKDEAKRVEYIVDREKEDVFKKLLSILDNFYRAEEEVEKREEEDSVIEGFLGIKKQIESFLEEEGVREINTIGEDFDPFYHDAIEAVDGEISGKIIEEFQRGYLYKDRVLRSAKVKVIK